MLHNIKKVNLLEKIISTLSYMTMGIIGLIWIIIAYANKKNLKYFLMYNISQSMVIAILLAILKIALDIVLSILAKIPFLSYVAAIFNYIISVKMVRVYGLGISFTIFELLVFILLAYIIAGVIVGRIFYIPALTSVMQKLMKKYN